MLRPRTKSLKSWHTENFGLIFQQNSALSWNKYPRNFSNSTKPLNKTDRKFEKLKIFTSNFFLQWTFSLKFSTFSPVKMFNKKKTEKFLNCDRSSDKFIRGVRKKKWHNSLGALVIAPKWGHVSRKTADHDCFFNLVNWGLTVHFLCLELCIRTI